MTLSLRTSIASHAAVFALVLVLTAASTKAATDATPTPAPAPGVAFALPLADGTTATAQILPGQANTSWLVYSTSTGQLATWTLTPPTPGPIPPPPPPTTAIKVAVVEDIATSTPAQRGIMADKAWRTAIPPPNTFHGIIPADLVDPTTNLPPESLRPFVAAAQGHALPAVVLLLLDDSPYRVAPLPESTTALLAWLTDQGIPCNGH